MSWNGSGEMHCTPKNVKVDIQPVYTTNPQRPTSFDETYEINGTRFTPDTIYNTATGDP